MQVLLTGPTGGAGQYILERLMTTSHDVRVLALPDAMHRVHFRDRIEMVPGELNDPVALEEATAGADIVFHAALVEPSASMNRQALRRVNVDGTRALIEASAQHAKRLVMVTSNNIYGLHRSPAMWPLTDDAPRHAHGPPQATAVAQSLIDAEDLLIDAGERGEIEYAILRPTIIAGRKAPAVDRMVITALRYPGQVETQRRILDMMQWTHGSDLAAAALLVAEHPDAQNQAFIVAGEEPITMYDIQRITWDIMNVGREDNPYDDIASRNNMGLCKREPQKLRRLGWRAKVTVREMITETLGRLDFGSGESAQLPTYLIHEGFGEKLPPEVFRGPAQVP